eukprot:UN00558
MYIYKHNFNMFSTHILSNNNLLAQLFVFLLVFKITLHIFPFSFLSQILTLKKQWYFLLILLLLLFVIISINISFSLFAFFIFVFEIQFSISSKSSHTTTPAKQNPYYIVFLYKTISNMDYYFL